MMASNGCKPGHRSNSASGITRTQEEEPVSAAPQPAQLTIVTGPGAGRSIELGQLTTVGRSADNTLAIPDGSISSHHLRIDAYPDGYAVTDLGSTNGSLHNGARLTQAAWLQDGDTLTLGPTVQLRFSVLPAVAAPPAAAAPPAYAATTPLTAGPDFTPPGPTQPYAYTPAPAPARAGLLHQTWARIVLVAIGLLAVAAGVFTLFSSLGGSSDKNQGTPVAGLPPQDLLAVLQRAPVAANVLPPGFAYVSSSPGTLPSGPQQYHALGAAQVAVKGPDPSNGIFYFVYPTTADAKGRFDRAASGMDVKAPGKFTPTGFTNPARCFTGSGTSNGQKIGETECFVLIGNVEIGAYSDLTGDSPTGNNDNATALARAGVAHLQLIASAANAPGGVGSLLAPTAGATPNLGSLLAPSASPSLPRATVSPTPTLRPTVAPTPSPSPTPRPSASPPLSSAPAPTTPQALLDRLLNAPFNQSELPAGFAKPTVSKGSLNEGPKAFRAIGEADVDMLGPDPYNGIIYIVYPTEADARGNFQNIAPTSSVTGTGQFTPPGFTDPIKCLTGTGTIQGQNAGTTGCVLLTGNVEVQGLSVLTGANVTHGNNDNAVALVKAGLAHLQRVQGGR